MADRKVIQLEDGAGNLYDVKDAEARADIEELDENKAEVDGYYEGLTAGSAEQLISSQMNNDQEPYVFRTAGGSADIGNRKNESIVGGTICWNQLVKDTKGTYEHSSVTLTNNGDNSVTMNGTADEASSIQLSGNTLVPFADNHVYLSDVNVAEMPGTARLSLSGISLGKATGGLFKNTPNYNGVYVRVDYHSGDVFNNLRLIPQVFDLTQMFGATIADYILSLETATAGAGVAWFRKLFPKPYYAYNAGELMSVKAAAMETVGFNQWDEEWELGVYNNDTGEKQTNNAVIRSKNKIPVFPNTSYYLKAPGSIRAFYYDKSENYISTNLIDTNATFVTPTEAWYMAFQIGSTTYNHDISINLSWSGYRNGEYEPYVKRTYPLDSSMELRGIPKLSADNTMYFDGDTYEPDGTVTRKYGIVDLGTLTWNYDSTELLFITNLTDGIHSENSNIHCVCQKYMPVVGYGMNGINNASLDKVVTVGSSWVSNASNLLIKDSAYTDAATFKTAMSGVYLVYELAEPTTEEAESFQNPQVVDDFGTERFIDAAYEAEERDVEIPVGHSTDYMANLRDKLQHLPDLGSGNGTYAIVQSNNQLSLTPLTTPTELPDAPTTDGTYALKVTVASGTPTYSWVAST